MSPCDLARRQLAAYVDGELLDDEGRVVQAHLAGCPACREAFAREGALSSVLAEAMPRADAPARLRQHVERMAASRASGRWRAAAAALALGAAAAGAGLWFLLRVPRLPGGPDGSELVRVAVDSHLRYARGQLPLEVRSERPEEVARWFAGRVPFHLALPDYPVRPGEEKFYRLEGGRLVSVQGDYAAFLAYEMDGRPISLLVTSGASVAPAGGETVDFGGLRFHLSSAAGLEVVTWTDSGLTYALASDLEVQGPRSCLVCHGSPEERARIQGFSRRPLG